MTPGSAGHPAGFSGLPDRDAASPRRQRDQRTFLPRLLGPAFSDAVRHRSGIPESSVRFGRMALVALALAGGAARGRGCSICSCSLNSDWGLLGAGGNSGWSFDSRYEYTNQTTTRCGTQQFDRSTVTFPTDNEIQLSTLNRTLWLGVDLAGASRWGVAVQLPVIDRDHATVAGGDTNVSTSHGRGIGDVRLVGRYRLTQTSNSSWSLQFGLKLPSGRIDQTFATGPQAGEALDRGLQLGSGTTDLIAGLSIFGRPLPELGTFAQATIVQSVAQRDGFSPSPSLTVSGGVRWLNSSRITPQLQVNAKWEGRERGAKADIENSGSVVVALSPGLTAEITNRIHAFAFVQVPVYQRVNGLQLEPRWQLSIGIRIQR
jgi:hypothetical protein